MIVQYMTRVGTFYIFTVSLSKYVFNFIHKGLMFKKDFTSLYEMYLSFYELYLSLYEIYLSLYEIYLSLYEINLFL